MNLFDKIISSISPTWGVSRVKARRELDIYAGYEAGTKGRLRKPRGDHKSGDTVAGDSTKSIRQLARDIDQNHDIGRGILNVLVNNTIGSEISIEPMVRDVSGKLIDSVNEVIEDIIKEWSNRPEVRKELNRGQAERLAARSWFRDGEMFVQHIEGKVSRFTHSTEVQYSIELIEADLVPDDFTDEKKKIKNGIERNAWGEAKAFHIYKDHPGNADYYRVKLDLKRVPATRMSHLKLTDRIGQGRGVSIFASIFTRLDDLRDFEESERIAARIAAAQVLAITKSPETITNIGDDSDEPRSFTVAPGTVWDDLLPGEKVEILSSDRPNNGLEAFRMGQLKAVSAGAGASYSSIAKDYKGSYSSQRQELSEQYGVYKVLTEMFVSQFTRPNHERLIRMALMSGRLELPNDVDMTTISAAEYRGPVAPWIDPAKETKAHVDAVDGLLQSRSQVIRARGGNPRDTFKQIMQEREMLGELQPKEEPEDEPEVMNTMERWTAKHEIELKALLNKESNTTINVENILPPSEINIDNKIEGTQVTVKNDLPEPVVNVTTNVEAPIVNVEHDSVVVNVENIVEAPEVTIENNIENTVNTPEVTVNLPTRDRKVEFERNKKGDIVDAKITDG